MKLSLVVISLWLSFQVLCQEHFVSSIDFNNKSQYARQILNESGNFILTTQSQCPDMDASCGGILRVNINGDIMDSFFIKDFSNNLNALLRHDGQYIYSGEFNMGSAKAFSVLK